LRFLVHKANYIVLIYKLAEKHGLMIAFSGQRIVYTQDTRLQTKGRRYSMLVASFIEIMAGFFTRSLAAAGRGKRKKAKREPPAAFAPVAFW
jgi:hypothetical protein